MGQGVGTSVGQTPPFLLQLPGWSGWNRSHSLPQRGLVGAWAVVNNQAARPPYGAHVPGGGEAGALGSEQTHLQLKGNFAK